MRPVAVRGPLPLVGLLLALAACGGDEGGGSPAGVGTLAYVVTSCREAVGVATLQQELRILHGDAEAVTAMSVGPLGPFLSIGVCAFSGRERGSAAPRVGAFQHLGATPDGSGVVFELNDAFALVGRDLLPAAQHGIYYVGADGSGLRRLGPATRFPAFFVVPGGVGYFVDYVLDFDPGGRQFAYVDLGPDDAGGEAPQVFVEDLAAAPPKQLTRLPRVAQAGSFSDIGGPVFTDARTILFYRFTEPPDRFTTLTVDAVDSHVSAVPLVALPGGALIPVFQIIGAQWRVIAPPVSGQAENPLTGASVREVFAMDGTNLVQLTNFRRVDTALFGGLFNRRDQRVYFTASADPLGTNPSHDCQIFSVEPLSLDLRQVTFFHEGGDHATEAACLGNRHPNGCRVDFTYPPPHNPATGTIYFRSQCDPLGLNQNGVQLFAIQPDGSGLRQLTNARGYVRAADGKVEVETVDFLWGYRP